MEIRKLLDRTVSLPVVLILIVVLIIVAFLLGNIGNLGGGDSTISVKATVTPADIGLEPGESRSVTIVVRNPNDYGVRVGSIGASSSEAADGCPAGVLTSTEVSNPIGYIRPETINAYPVPVTLADNAPDRCLEQALALPLTVELASAS
ncbi:MAG: hypothetical protein ACREX8_03950 [Gammaproteobacteria bacterium]